MTISVLFQPVVEIVTDDDGSNPRLGGVDWCDSFTMVVDGDGMSPEPDDLPAIAACHIAEVNGGKWLDRRYRFANRVLTLALRRPVLRRNR